MALTGAAEELFEALSPAFTTGAEESMAKFCEVLTAGDVEDVWRWVTDQEGPGWQILLNPAKAPAAVLPWLAQFDGAVLIPRMTEAEQRLTITSPQAFGRGTVAQIEEVAKRGLTGSKFVKVEERAFESAWKIRVTTLLSETPDPARLKAEIEAQAKPIGLILFLNETHTLTWAELRAREASSTWVKTRSKYATWGILRSSE